jgi:hypothetical protein
LKKLVLVQEIPAQGRDDSGREGMIAVKLLATKENKKVADKNHFKSNKIKKGKLPLRQLSS